MQSEVDQIIAKALGLPSKAELQKLLLEVEVDELIAAAKSRERPAPVR
jgi:hypothetical protein